MRFGRWNNNRLRRHMKSTIAQARAYSGCPISLVTQAMSTVQKIPLEAEQAKADCLHGEELKASVAGITGQIQEDIF